MIRDDEVLLIGSVQKPHGVNGEVTVSTNGVQLSEAGAPYLVLRLDGILVPFFMESVRDRSQNTAIVKFEGIGTLEKAESFRGVQVYFPRAYEPEIEEEEPDWHWFTGFEVIDADAGLLGTVTAVDDSTPNILLLVSGEDRERIIPANVDWIENVDSEGRKLYFSLPEGLTDL